ncbi:class I fructose-bisphosphate aldolase [Methanocella arvoryzae]|uniref:fructose-bisphosphate aldolase n=1 Tax=Methanocella arvoryzae (strain DSM 22066 / NBRC 105507 / MRE50) TaxID=351160 RepID=Q0W650_METAR|nr:fructose-bisphosphate aldolase [Methanocella arvoryzae]CAJ36143.1 fructose-bisphosphate aldolase (class I) [Methanocella arvoryzae MRE50]
MVGASEKYMSRLFRDGKAMFLAYDQGLEHGPKDFNDRNYDPCYIIDIALKNKFTGLIFHKGLAEKYHEHFSGKIPLIVKVNGKDNIAKTEPFSPVVCSVDYAVKLGAEAVGYTLYVGSPLESKAMEDFRRVHEEAREYGLPVIGWMYPRGQYVPNDTDPTIVAYGARVGLELGADVLKVKYTGNKETFKRVVQMAGRSKVVCAGGLKTDANTFMQQTRDILDAGACGVAVGRNVWQSDRPDKIARALEALIFENAPVSKAMEVLSA